MIYRLMRNIEAMLRARRFPIETVYGIDRVPFAGFTSNLIRFERDPEQSDAIGAPKSPGTLASPMKAIRGIAVRVTIYGQSPLSGAMPSDHDHETDQLVDAAIVALTEWCVAAQTGVSAPSFTEARFATDDGERKRLFAEGWNGAVYVLRFRIPRAVNALNYVSGELPGTPRERGTVEHVENEIRILRPGGSPEIV